MRKILFIFLCFGLTLPAFSSFTNPDSTQFYLAQALQFKQQRKFVDADKNFLKAIGLNSASEEVRIEYGNYLLDVRKHFVAIDQFKKVLEKNGNHPIALQKVTDISFMLRRWSDVIFYGKQLLEKKIGLKVKYMMGKAYYEEEEYGLSQKILIEAVKETPKDIEALTLLGRVHIEVSDYKQAFSVYSSAVELDPDNNNLIYEFALLYYTLNKEKEAVKYFKLAAEKGYKTDLDYKENLGMAYLSFDIKTGVEILNQVLEKKPNEPEILFQIAQAYYKADNFVNAADIYDKLYKSDPSNNKALYMTGIAYQKMGDKEKGNLLCDKAIKLDPSLGQLKKLMVGK